MCELSPSDVNLLLVSIWKIVLSVSFPCVLLGFFLRDFSRMVFQFIERKRIRGTAPD